VADLQLTLAINDEFKPAAEFLGTQTVSRNPTHVTYTYNPTMDFAADGTAAGHAYWVYGVALREGGGEAPLGTIDVRSEGFGLGDAPVNATETGAGQWGSALAFACNQFGLECFVYMVAASYHQKPYRRVMMETWGGQVVPSPSDRTQAGKAILARDPDTSGSLGIAISEAVEDAATHPDTHYSLGSVLNHVLLHQTVIGLEAKQQLEQAGEGLPDVVLGSCGGGSNLAGLALPFVPDCGGANGGNGPRLVAVEPSACPTLTEGRFDYDFGDEAGMTPKILMYTLGHEFIPPPIHAGGLRYHGDAPIICNLVKNGWMEAVAYPQGKVFEAAMQFARSQGTIPAPETAHAIRGAIDEALAAKEAGEERVILFNYSGHGLLDLAAYDAFLHGQLVDV